MKFGIDGHNFWLQYLRHLEYLKHIEKPKTILLSVDVFSLKKRIDLHQMDQFLPYMLWNSNIKKYTNSYVGYDKSDYLIPLVRYYGKSNSKNLIIKNVNDKRPTKRYRKKGYLGMDKEWNSDLEKAKEQRNSYKIQTDSNSIVLFDKFINECISNNIELIFVYAPEYIEGQKFVKNRKEIIQLFQDFSTKYSLQFYDYSNDSLCFEKKYFYNSMHLNKFGSEIFTKQLASDLNARTH